MSVCTGNEQGPKPCNPAACGRCSEAPAAFQSFTVCCLNMQGGRVHYTRSSEYKANPHIHQHITMIIMWSAGQRTHVLGTMSYVLQPWYILTTLCGSVCRSCVVFHGWVQPQQYLSETVVLEAPCTSPSACKGALTSVHRQFVQSETTSLQLQGSHTSIAHSVDAKANNVVHVCGKPSELSVIA